MARKRKTKRRELGGASRSHAGNVAPDRTHPSQSAERDDAPLSVSEWKERRAIVRRAFPGPRNADVPLRVAVERNAYAEIVAHAKNSLDAEICGVLAGSTCRDEEGEFIHVAAVVRGTHAAEGSRHVTFTQETWNTIHAAMEQDHPRLQIVGWYHSHPGFGVEFSEMDLFIQKNFFAGTWQIGLLIDPLGGDVAICMNADDGIRYLPRFWVDAREHRCRAPSRTAQGAGEAAGGRQGMPDEVAALETRISQLVHAVDDMRRTLYRWVYGLGMLLGFAIILFISRQVAGLVFGEIPQPPSRVSFVPIPVNIDGKPCLIGVDVVSWEVPPELIHSPPPGDKNGHEQEDGEKEEPAPDGEPASPPTRSGRQPARLPAGDRPATKGDAS